jgi:hypothetical protein
MNSQFSHLYQDKGYNVMRDNICLGCILPYAPNVEPRIVNYLRELYNWHKRKVTTCVPLTMKFHIKTEDWTQIHKYIIENDIKIFNKNIEYKRV